MWLESLIDRLHRRASGRRLRLSKPVLGWVGTSSHQVGPARLLSLHRETVGVLRLRPRESAIVRLRLPSMNGHRLTLRVFRTAIRR